MKGTGNHFRRSCQRKCRCEHAATFLESRYYRNELIPFLGCCVDMVCDDFCYKRTTIDNQQCTAIFLKTPRIIKVPAKVRSFPLPTFHHMWCFVEKDWMPPDELPYGLRIRGHLYEYVKKSKKNIGIQVYSTKPYMKEEE